jgi:hypothetical protein
MDSNNQRWLSLDGICTVLQTTHKHVLWLAKNGHLEVLWGNGSRKQIDARFLDPTPKYAERLRLAEMIYMRRYPVDEDFDLPTAALFTKRELAQIMGWTIGYARKFFAMNRDIPSIKVAGNLVLYPASTIRDLIWLRRDRTLSKQKAPFLLKELIAWFVKFQAAEEEEVPTDLEFQEDDLLHRKLTRLSKLPSPEREVAMRDFYDKVALAKQVASVVKTETPAP